LSTRIVNVPINFVINDEQLKRIEHAAMQADKATAMLRQDAKGLGNDIKKSADTGAKSFSMLGSVAKTVAATLAAISLVQLVKDTFRLTSEMQRLGSVLQNTLGSRSAAQQALRDIQTFAAKTPFQVIGLTDAFVKLANRGVVPAMEDMRAMGDLSATLGKDFMQLTEAILDINNDVRWKELGIRAKAAGDKMIFSFRGVNVESDRTVEGVKNAIVQLGNLKGVAGSMAGVSATLGGKWSNFVDNLEILASTLGNNTSGLPSLLLDLANNAFGALNKALNDNMKALQSEQVELNVLVGAITAVNVPTHVRAKLIEELNRKYPDFLKNLDTEKVTNEQLKTRLEDVNKQFMRKIALQAAEDRFKDTQEDIIDLLDDEIESRKRLEAVKQGAIKIRPMTTKGGAEGLTDEQAKAQEIARLEHQIADIQKERTGIQTELNDRLTEYNKALDLFTSSANDYFKSETKITDKTKDDSESMKKMAQEVNDYLAYLSDLEMFETKELLNDKSEQRKNEAERQREINKTSFEHWKYYNDLRRQKEKEASEEAIKIAEDEALRRMQLQEQLTNAAFQLARGLTDLIYTTRSNETEAIEDYYEREMNLAKDNDSLQRDLMAKKERDLEAARQREKDAYKSQSIKKILAETAINIVEAYPDPIRMALAAALGGLQAGNVRRLNKGVIDLQGPGTETSDSIPAFLSRRESVMTAGETKGSKGILKAIRAKTLNDKMLHELMTGRSGGFSFSDQKIVEELGSIKEELKNNRPADIVERHGMLMKATKKGQSYKQFVRAKIMGNI
jgi:hypothetical protein